MQRMNDVSRREFVARSGAAALGMAACRSLAAAAPQQAGFTLGFSLYGAKSLSLDAAVRLCADVGYDDVELALLPGFASDPESLPADARKKLRDDLRAAGLRVPALMDNLPLAVKDDVLPKHLDRIARAAELAHELSADRPPLLETILGGKPDEWPELRNKFVDRLGAWAEAARKHRLTIAVKPHVMQALHTPDDALWLLDQVKSPQIRLAYDYSHYQAQELDLEATLRKLAPHVVFIHVKDVDRRDGKIRFLLPGQGTIDYGRYFRLLAEIGYAGSVTVEVSAMLHTQADYDPRAAVAGSYQPLAKAWQSAGLGPRRRTAP